MDSHTAAKHFVLRRYLGGWFPILSKRTDRIVYLDGFAGPGQYSGGEEGSPVIAIRTAIEHKFPLAKEVIFYFIEAEPERRAHLEALLKATFPSPPGNVKWAVSGSEFAEQVEGILDSLEEKGSRLAPTFAFIDPFGYSDLPMKTVARLLSNDRCEVLITFMEKFVNRFAETGLHDAAITELFGTDRWLGVRSIKDAGERRSFLLGLYIEELKRRVTGAHVRTFEMVDKFNQVLYFLVHATRSQKGVEVMKDAMWAVDKAGNYRFSDRSDPSQRTLLDLEDEAAWIGPAAETLWRKFRASVVNESDVKAFVVVETPYPYRKKILRRLLEEGRLAQVEDARQGTFPDGSDLHFAK